MRILLLLLGGLIPVVSPAVGAGGPVPAPQHWAYRVPVAPATSGEGHPIDELLALGQGARGLEVVGEASRPVLLRRAWHVLTGLQPDPGTHQRLLADPSEIGPWIGAVIEEGFASPHFGERWARHWLDVARYADTKGYDFTSGRLYPFAFTYRDWVIRSFNEDLPYDEFVRRQIAADLMEVEPPELAALGFLTVGRRFLRKNDLIIADRIDVVFRSTMAVTMACVRCHDHKFDPLTTADYYGLYGVFDSIDEPQDLPIISPPEQSEAYEEFRTELTKRAKAVHDFAAEKIQGYQRPEDPLQFDHRAARKKLNQSERGEYNRLLAKMTKLEATSPAAPLRAMVVRDKETPSEPVIFERGQPGNRGPKVPRAFPAFFRDNPEAVFTRGSGRLELAHDLTRPTNPLTARVFANRVWMHLMGEPLVPSPGDFGMQTEPPLHPGLLDHLAVYLMKHGWSTKALVRHIMTSEAWRRSSSSGEVLTRDDPENRYYARSNRHRKGLEAWRDTTLQASGRLQPEIGGRPVKIHEAPFPPRRTVYGLIERQNPPSFFRTFDFPDSNQPVERRAATTTPNQALYLMNSPFLHEEAKATAGACELEGTEERRIALLYRRVLQRDPTPQESRRSRGFLKDASGQGGQSAGAWIYGHGRLHPDSGTVDFQPFRHFTGQSWQGGPELPDPETGWVHWRAGAGHPGRGDHAAIMRWEATRAATVSIEGRLWRPQKEGDGIRALVVSNRQVLGEWEVAPGEATKSSLGAFQVEAGQLVDFIVESTGNENSDTFHWEPVITGAGKQFPLAEAKEGFSGPTLDPWAQLAQILLLSNEFLFID